MRRSASTTPASRRTTTRSRRPREADGEDAAMPGEALAEKPAPRTPVAHGDASAVKPAAASADVIARVLIERFDRHYALFRDCAKAAQRDFEAGNWLAIGHLARD